jgi:hypothetical protein
MEGSLSAAGFVKAAHAAHSAPGDLPAIAPAECVDTERDCRAWAAAGECLNNAGYMMGSGEGGAGACVASCGLCGDSVEPSASSDDDCRDVYSDCAPLRDAGECSNNPE